MKLFKSIKWRLQIWYGLILVVVLAGFGLTAYQLARDQQFGRIDGELNRRVGILIHAMHRPPPRVGDFDSNGPPPDGQNPFGGPDRPEMREGRPPPDFHLPPEDAHYFDDSDPHDFYFRIVHIQRNRKNISREDQTEIARSTNFPGKLMSVLLTIPTTGPPRPLTGPSITPFATPPPFSETANNTPPPIPPEPGQNQPGQAKSDDHYRETCQFLPSGEGIEVGCSILPEQHELGLTALRLAVFGGVILLLGLAGGGWLVGRALRPVAEISSAAAQISGSDLTRRASMFRKPKANWANSRTC